jgi:hypothetical protein
MCGVSIYYASFWVGDPQNLRLNEARLGTMLGLFYGWPAWLGLPLLVAAQWRTSPAWERAVLLSPPLFALVIYVGGLLLTRQ